MNIWNIMLFWSFFFIIGPTVSQWPFLLAVLEHPECIVIAIGWVFLCMKFFFFFPYFYLLFLFFFPSPVLWRAEAASCWDSLYPQKRWTRQTVNTASSRLSALTDVWCFAPSCSRPFQFGKNWMLTGTHIHLRANHLCTTHIHMHTVLPHSDSWSFTLLAAQRTGGRPGRSRQLCFSTSSDEANAQSLDSPPIRSPDNFTAPSSWPGSSVELNSYQSAALCFCEVSESETEIVLTLKTNLQIFFSDWTMMPF